MLFITIVHNNLFWWIYATCQKFHRQMREEQVTPPQEWVKQNPAGKTELQQRFDFLPKSEGWIPGSCTDLVLSLCICFWFIHYFYSTSYCEHFSCFKHFWKTTFLMLMFYLIYLLFVPFTFISYLPLQWYYKRHHYLCTQVLSVFYNLSWLWILLI